MSAETSEESLSNEMKSFVSGGRMSRMACGTISRRRALPWVRSNGGGKVPYGGEWKKRGRLTGGKDVGIGPRGAMEQWMQLRLIVRGSAQWP
jgi:hypothetical protein